MRTKAAGRAVGLDLLKAVACIVLHHYQQMSGATFAGVNFFIPPELTRGVMLLFLLGIELVGALLFVLVEKPLARFTKRYEWDKLKIVDPA